MAMSLRFKNRKAFEKALDVFIEEEVPDATLLFQKKIAIELLSRIIDKNPVGNPDLWSEASLPPPEGYVGGRSRSNWQVSITTPTEASIVGIDPTGVAANTAGLTEMAGAKPYGAIWIFNNVRYITKLEDGHSTQAPAGMVGVSLAEITAFFKKGT